jgi:hypothetical protein
MRLEILLVVSAEEKLGLVEEPRSLLEVKLLRMPPVEPL